jgi:hypothetical protein
MLSIEVRAVMDSEPRMLLKTISWVFRSQQKARNLSQLSHGLTGPDGTTASIPDIWQDPYLRIWIPAHCLDARH